MSTPRIAADPVGDISPALSASVSYRSDAALDTRNSSRASPVKFGYTTGSPRGPSRFYEHATGTMRDGRYDALFIDFYGTITAGDKQAVEQTCRLVVGDLRLTLPAEELAIAWGRRFFAALDTAHDGAFRNLFELERETLVETVEPLAGPFDPVPFVRHLKEYWSAPALHPEARQALEALDVPLCCVSNADTEDVQAAVERHGLRFDHVITSEDARSYKPHAAIFQKALAKMGVAADRVMHVGDSLHSDVGGAKPLGIDTTWICRDDRIFDVGESRPDHKIMSLLELPSLLS